MKTSALKRRGLSFYARGRLGATFNSWRMPFHVGALMIGVPIGVAACIAIAVHQHLRVNVDTIYYPTTIFVYVVWIIPIIGFMVFAAAGRSAPDAQPQTKFICMVPAYNEREVIGNPVNSLLAQDYPKELYDVWVIFDGTDATGEIARELGANVLVTPTNGYGKHKALKFAFEQLLTSEDDRFVAVFDADNVVSSNYLRAMNNSIVATGARCLQSFHDVLNGKANWVTKALWASCVSSSRLYLGGRMRLLSNALICGTGWCCEALLLRKYWKRIRTQTEDIELNGILALEEGVRVRYVPEARIYDEKPLTLWVAIRQRMRWMCGHARVCWYYFAECTVKGIIRRDIALLELALYYTVPFALLASFATWPVLAGLFFHVFTVSGWLAYEPVQYVLEFVSWFFILAYQVVGFWKTDVGTRHPVHHAFRICLYSAYSVIFALIVWPPALIWALFKVGEGDWLFHTPHGHAAAVVAPELGFSLMSPDAITARDVAAEVEVV